MGACVLLSLSNEDWARGVRRRKSVLVPWFGLVAVNGDAQ
jgi:hypothetical protein